MHRAVLNSMQNNLKILDIFAILAVDTAKNFYKIILKQNINTFALALKFTKSFCKFNYHA